jgi:FkbM family methyltransferase
MAANNPIVNLLRGAKRCVRSAVAVRRMRSALRRVFPGGRGGDDAWVVFDVGANVGQTALQLRRVLKGVARPQIHCFEPFAENYAALQANTAGVPSIHTHRMGMAAEAGAMTVPLSPESQWHSIANQDEWRGRAEAIETIALTTLDTFAASAGIERIAILKTDTEGYDLEVLRGGRSLLESARIGLVICEVGFNPEDRQHTYFPAVFALLLGHGYRLCLLEEQMVYRSAVWGDVPSIGYANAWFVAPATPHR